MKYALFEKTHPAAAEALIPYIKDKHVFELGSGDGCFAELLALYAKRVTAIEADTRLAMDSTMARKNVETINGDFMNANLERAEVIYCFLSPAGMWALGRKIQEANWNGVLISNLWPLRTKWMKEIPPDKVIDVVTYDGRFPLLVYKNTFASVYAKD